MFKKQKKQFFLQVAGVSFIFAIIAGSLSGVIATVITNKSLDSYYQTLTEQQEILAISQIRPEAIPGTYEEAISRVKDQSQHSIAVMRLNSTDSANPAQWMSEGEKYSTGVVITSDGWLLFHSSTFGMYPLDYFDVWVDGERYEVQDSIGDFLSASVLLKVEADNLRPIAFGDSQALESGEYVFAASMPGEILPVHIASTNNLPENLDKPAEVFTHGWLLDRDVDAVPLLNAAGEFVAMGGFGDAVPLEHSYAFLQSVLRTGENQRATLGVSVIELQDVVNLADDLPSYGAYVTSVESGAGADAGVQVGDIILGISGRMVENGQTLAEVITQFDVEDTVYVEVLRDGNKLELELTF